MNASPTNHEINTFLVSGERKGRCKESVRMFLWNSCGENGRVLWNMADAYIVKPRESWRWGGFLDALSPTPDTDVHAWKKRTRYFWPAGELPVHAPWTDLHRQLLVISYARICRGKRNPLYLLWEKGQQTGLDGYYRRSTLGKNIFAPIFRCPHWVQSHLLLQPLTQASVYRSLSHTHRKHT